MTSLADLVNYNVGTQAPATPWGLTNSAVGGQSSLNVPNFVSQYITNPSYTSINNAAGTGYMPSAATLAAASQLLSGAPVPGATH